ncbi:hypothetical protein YSA_10022 [Pseudomonas putida ND6]|uniref:Uncharacterized protein n=1 Tax=Pseudomonas putida ND6 TaxID=231023 RepID=I3V392_PSEPU|nr:hypothetical protein YSA_10022 [Pseudomonas putida ND6]
MRMLLFVDEPEMWVAHLLGRMSTQKLQPIREKNACFSSRRSIAL